MEMANRGEHMRLLGTEYGRVTVQFTEALAGGQYSTARDLLAQPLKSELPEGRLKDRFERLIFGGVVALVEAMEGYEDYPDKPEGDIGGIGVASAATRATTR